MQDFDFTKPQPPEAAGPFKPAQSRYYDPKVAEKLFRAAGKPERFAAGQVVFAEDEKAKGLFKAGARMYFVLEGEIALTHHGKPLDTVKAGDVLGEGAVVTELPRSATATAKTACSVVSLDRGEFQDALAQTPEFALMLMSVIFERLRFLLALFAARGKAVAAAGRESSVFDAAMLERFEQGLPRTAAVRHWGGEVIMREGQRGAFMYVVKSGRVAISIRGNAVDVLKTGDTFGEMALVDQSPRTATATAETECELLQVDRPSLLAAVRGQPDLAMALLRAVADRLRYMTEQLN